MATLFPSNGSSVGESHNFQISGNCVKELRTTFDTRTGTDRLRSLAKCRVQDKFFSFATVWTVCPSNSTSERLPRTSTRRNNYLILRLFIQAFHMAFVSPLPVLWKKRYPTLNNCYVSLRTYHVRSPCRMELKAASLPKQTLLEKLTPLNFGRDVVNSPQKQKEIEDLVKEVEAVNPSPNPATDPNITGAWKLLYTTSKSILGMDKPAFLRGASIIQEIDAATLTGRNVEGFKVGPFDLTNFVTFKLKPTSPSRFDVNFLRFSILGLFTFNPKGKGNSLRAGWVDITYLDGNLRITRGNKGSLFVLVK